MELLADLPAAVPRVWSVDGPVPPEDVPALSRTQLNWSVVSCTYP